MQDYYTDSDAEDDHDDEDETLTIDDLHGDDEGTSFVIYLHCIESLFFADVPKPRRRRKEGEEEDESDDNIKGANTDKQGRVKRKNSNIEFAESDDEELSEEELGAVSDEDHLLVADDNLERGLEIPTFSNAPAICPPPI